MQHGLGGFVVTGWGWPVLGALAACIASIAMLPLLAAIPSCVLALVMAAIAMEDARAFRIPDVLSLPMIPVGLAVTALLAPAQQWGESALLSAAAATAGAGLLMAVRIGYRSMRGREGLGLGDVKLAAVAGAWVGPLDLPTVLLVACGLAFAAIGMRAVSAHEGARLDGLTAIPFGLFLAPAIWLTWFAIQAFGS